MATNLQLDQALSTTAQSITDQEGNASPLTLSTDKVGIRTTDPVKQLHIEDGDIAFRWPDLPENERLLVFMRTKIGDEKFGYKFSWRNDDGSFQKNMIELDKNGDVYFRGPHVGIGTSEPKTPLHVVSKSPDNGLRVGVANKSTVVSLHVSDGNYGYLHLGGDTKLRGNGRDSVFQGNIIVSGDVQLTGADCAENFDVEESQALNPGTVLVIGDEDKLHQCTQAYDRRVAGVLSGAGNYRPGIILGQEQSQNKRMPLALTGKVYCKVDAQYSPIEIGDLLTTSLTPGHAMKAADPLKAFGAVIGKALRPLTEGQGLIPVLVALQ